MDEFLQHSIDTKADMIESYVLGNRLVRLLSTLLPRHRDYYSPDVEATRARAKSQEQLIKVLRYIDQLAILIDKEEHASFIGTVIRKSSESHSSHGEDQIDIRPTQSSLKINVCESVMQNTSGGDLGFSMILASESDRSCVSTHNDSYATELKDISWMSNSIVAEVKSDMIEDLRAPTPLVRQERTLLAQDDSLEKSMEEEQVCFQNALISCEERGSFPSGRVGGGSLSKLDRHFRVYRKVNDASWKDPSVGYVSSTSSEHQPVKSDVPLESMLDMVSSKAGKFTEDVKTTTYGSCQLDKQEDDQVTLKPSNDYKIVQVAQDSMVSTESSATSYYEDTVTAAQISLTDSMGFPTTDMNVSQQEFDAIQKASSRSRSFAEFDAKSERSNQMVSQAENDDYCPIQDSFIKSKDIDRANDRPQDNAKSTTSEAKSHNFSRSFDSNGEIIRIVGCSFVKTPTKDTNPSVPMDVCTSTTKSSRSRRNYSCTAGKPADYEAISLSPRPGIESISCPRDEKLTSNAARHQLRTLRQDLHTSFMSASSNCQARSSRNESDLLPNRDESSASTPTSSSRSLSQSPNWNSTVVAKAIPAESEDYFAIFSNEQRSDVGDPFSVETWSPNDYFSSHEPNDRTDTFSSPSWTNWSDDEELFLPQCKTENSEAQYSDPSWFELEDHAAAKAIEITPSDSFDLHQRSSSAEEPLSSAHVGFTKVSKSLSPICETSTTNSTSYARSRDSDFQYYGSDSALTNGTLRTVQGLFGQQSQDNAAHVCVLDPRGLMTCRSRRLRRRNFGPIDLDDSIDDGFRCGKKLVNSR